MRELWPTEVRLMKARRNRAREREAREEEISLARAIRSAEPSLRWTQALKNACEILARRRGF